MSIVSLDNCDRGTLGRHVRAGEPFLVPGFGANGPRA